ncbi:MAG: ribosome-associated translation inhibitor RaiA [Solirubrobacterales bacterium]
MQIDIRARNGVTITDDLRAYAQKRFEKVSRQVSEPARLELELNEEHNPSIAQHYIVDAVLYMKGSKLRASDRSFEMKHAIHEVSDELGRQVDKQRSKKRFDRDIQKFSTRSQDALAFGDATQP